MDIRKIRDKKGRVLSEQILNELCNEIEKTLKTIGFDCYVDIINSQAIKISNVRVNTDVWGYNISPYTGRRGNVLNYVQWIVVNTTINLIFDNLQYSAKITTLKGKFLIRNGFKKYTVYDWAFNEDDNVGSIIHPILRIEAWKPSNIGKFKNTLEKAFEYLKQNFGKAEDLRNYIQEHYEYCLRIVNLYYLNE